MKTKTKEMKKLMDNNELDKILKEKLKGKIQMPQEMQEKINKCL